MFQLFTKGCEYTLWALADIASRPQGRPVSAGEVCRNAGIPEAYTRKTFQGLVQSGFLKAVPGPHGGYSLTGDPEKITVMEIVRAVEGDEGFRRCVLGLPECNSSQPCPMHTLWKDIRGKMTAALEGKTLSQLSRGLRRRKKGKVVR